MSQDKATYALWNICAGRPKMDINLLDIADQLDALAKADEAPPGLAELLKKARNELVRLRRERDLYVGVLRTIYKADLFEVPAECRDYAHAAIEDGEDVKKGLWPRSVVP